ncbi:MAG TPA: hypothetical protein VGG31_02995 [Candidatus Dormibacteraeota bacterium]|jgi:hypothetical protein
MNRAVRAAALLCLVLAACGTLPQPAPSSAPVANVTGRLDGGVSPTCPAGEPCDPPLTASRLVFARAGHADVTVGVGPDGSFSTRLDPGAYSISVQPPLLGARLEPSSVRVPDSGSVEIRLQIVRSAT